jgi:hypothetical protein
MDRAGPRQAMSRTPWQRALLAAALLGALTAHAETLASVYLGLSLTHPSVVRLRQEGGTDLRLRAVAWSTRPLSPPLYYGLRVRYFPDDDASLGVMLDFVHDKARTDAAQVVQVEGQRAGQALYAREPVGSSLQRFELSHGLNQLSVHLVFRFGGCVKPVQCRARTSVHASSGLGVLIPHVEASVPAGREDGYQLSGPSLQLALGVLSPERWRLSLLGEYRFSRARLHADVPGGSVDTRLATHHLLVGPTFRLE